jgi:hypothetical protein
VRIASDEGKMSDIFTNAVVSCLFALPLLRKTLSTNSKSWDKNTQRIVRIWTLGRAMICACFRIRERENPLLHGRETVGEM